MNIEQLLQSLNDSRTEDLGSDFDVAEHLQEIGALPSSVETLDLSQLMSAANALRQVKPPYNAKFLIEAAEAIALPLKVLDQREEAGLILFDVGNMLQLERVRDYRDGMSTMAFKFAQFYWRVFPDLRIKTQIAELESILHRSRFRTLSEADYHHAISRCDSLLTQCRQKTTAFGKVLLISSKSHLALAIHGVDVEHNLMAAVAEAERSFEHMEPGSDGFPLAYLASAEAAVLRAKYALTEDDTRGSLSFAETRLGICADHPDCPDAIRREALHLKCRAAANLLSLQDNWASEMHGRELQRSIENLSDEFLISASDNFDFAMTQAVYLLNCPIEEDWLPKALNCMEHLTRHRDSMEPGEYNFALAFDLIGGLTKRAAMLPPFDQMKSLWEAHICWLHASGCFETDSLMFSHYMLVAMESVVQMSSLVFEQGYTYDNDRYEDNLDRAIAYGVAGMENIDRIWKGSTAEFRSQFHAAWHPYRTLLVKTRYQISKTVPSHDSTVQLLVEITKAKNRTFVEPLFALAEKLDPVKESALQSWEDALQNYWHWCSIVADYHRSGALFNLSQRGAFLRRHDFDESRLLADSDGREPRDDRGYTWSEFGRFMNGMLEEAEEALIALEHGVSIDEVRYNSESTTDPVEAPESEVTQRKKKDIERIENAELSSALAIEMMGLETMLEMLRGMNEMNRRSEILEEVRKKRAAILDEDPKNIVSFLENIWIQSQSSSRKTLFVEMLKLQEDLAIALIFPSWIRDAVFPVEVSFDFLKIREEFQMNDDWFGLVMEMLRSQIESPSERKKAFTNIAELSEYLGSTLAPIRNCLLENRLDPDDIVFCPTDSLYLVPLHVARWEDEITWLDRFPISYIPSLAMADNSTRPSAPGIKGHGCIVGNPSCKSSISHLWGDLLFASKEAEIAASRLKSSGYDVIHLEGESAKALTVRNALQNADIVHFAAHYEFSKDERSRGFILADRILSAFELKKLGQFKESCLVVASVCHGAAPRLSRSEDLFSLSQELLGAGVASVVSSLGSLDDKASLIFTDAFYEAYLVQGLPLNQAVRQAVLALKHDLPESDQWAKFYLTGQWDMCHKN